MEKLIPTNETHDDNFFKINHFEKEKGAVDIAIIGMSIKMPLADSMDDFWENIRNGVDCVNTLPEKRLTDIEPYLRYKLGQSDIKTIKGSFLEEIADFDYHFFGISPKEAELMDPLQRILFQNIYEAIEDSGYTKERLSGSNTGIFLGAIGDIDKFTYRTMVRENNILDCPIALTGNLLSMIPGRVAYMLNLKGPTLVIDTACSSSLVAVHEACQKIKNKECSMAIVSSGRIHIFPIDDVDKIGIESNDYYTRTFDEGANGSGFGEGFISIILKPMDKALEDKDNIYAVIKGSAVGQDGTSKDLTAPNPKAQEALICKVWEEAEINPEDISYIECHGTATKLGDPIEINALNRAFSKYTDKKQFCAVGSIKSNLGHLLECSGIVGLVKCVLAMNHHEIPPTLHFQNPNKMIPFIESSVYVNKKLQQWNVQKRICGVSSFGLSGVNCHMILEEVPNVMEPLDVIQGQANRNKMELFTLSAKSETALYSFIQKYSLMLEKLEDDKFHSFCYSTNTGKSQYKYRLAVCSEKKSELYDKLQLILQNGFSNGLDKQIFCNIAEGDITDEMSKSAIHKTEQKKERVFEDYLLMCKRYVSGLEINWSQWYGKEKIKRMRVPLYPFKKNKCWIEWNQRLEQVHDDERIDDYFYHVVWKKSQEKPELSEKEAFQGKKVVVLRDNSDKTNSLVETIKNYGANLIEVIIGNEGYLETKNIIYMENKKDDYQKMLEYVSLSEINYIIHAVNGYHNEPINTVSQLNERINLGFYSLFYLAQSIGSYRITNYINLVLLSNCAYEVTKEEKTIQPSNAAFLGLGKNINLEFSNCRCRAIDFDDTTDVECVISQIVNEKSKYATAIRNNEVYKEEFDYVDMQQPQEEELLIKNNGVYIITGGLGKIGLHTAEYISSKANAHIIMISRRSFPDKESWEDYCSDSNYNEILLRIRKIEEMGSNVVVYQADIAQEQSLSIAIRTIEKRFGKINGVIHAAGITGNGYIVMREIEEVKQVLEPKIQGTWLLDRYLLNQQLDFFLMYSSGVSLIGEVGLADYTAANAYMDSFSSIRNREKRTLSINWVVWKKARMGDGYSKNVDGIFKSIEPEKAIQCLDLALKHKINRILIGCLDYQSEYLQSINSMPFAIAESIQKRIKVPVIENRTTSRERKEVKIIGDMNTLYTDMEKNISKIVGNILGIQEVNIYDNFFEMGVTSIILDKIYVEIEKEYPEKLMVSDMFAYSSIHKLSQFISSQMKSTKQTKKEHINDLAQKIKNMNNTDDIESILEKL